MGRHAYHKCALRSVDTSRSYSGENTQYQYWLTWCGDSKIANESDRVDLKKSRRESTCPKCSAAIGAHQLAKLGRVKLTRADPESQVAKRHRSAFILTIDGIERGAITSERGFGKGWQLSLAPTAKDDWRGTGNDVSGDAPPAYRTYNETAHFQPVHFRSRDAMAVAAWAAFERGELPTAAEREERAARTEEERRERDAENERLRSARIAENVRKGRERMERIDTATAALVALEARPDLSNLESAGIAAMRALLADMGKGDE